MDKRAPWVEGGLSRQESTERSERRREVQGHRERRRAPVSHDYAKRPGSHQMAGRTTPSGDHAGDREAAKRTPDSQNWTEQVGAPRKATRASVTLVNRQNSSGIRMFVSA